MYYTIKYNPDISFRIYQDSRPNKYKSAKIQKGLIVLYKGEEVSGEGVGFGTPVVKYKNKTYFSMDAVLSVSDNHNFTDITKIFEINGAFYVKIFNGHITNPIFYYVTNSFSKLHRENRTFRVFADIILALLRKMIRRPADLLRVPSKGRIAVNYKIYKDRIHIVVDSTALDKNNCEEICIMNEQGADFFRKYYDTDRNILIDDEIGSWEKVNTKSAFFSDLEDRTAFCLFNISDANLFRGREKFKGHLAWAGLAYLISPKTDIFEYDIKIISNLSCQK